MVDERLPKSGPIDESHEELGLGEGRETLLQAAESFELAKVDSTLR